MRFALTDEQELLRGELRRFLEDRAPIAATRTRMEAGGDHDPRVWEAMVRELGLHALYVPEELGGPGTGAVDVAVAMEELGRVVHPGPFLASAVLATRALVHAGAEEPLAGLLAGKQVATLAHADDGGAWRSELVATTGTEDGADGTLALTGTKQRVVDGVAADLLLVAARLPGTAGHEGVVLTAVDPAGPGVRREPLDVLDPTRPLATVRLDGAPGRVLAGDGAADVLNRAVLEAGAAVAAEMVGAAQRCLEATVEYAAQRVQFEQPIGAFQALKHRCADLLVELEHARSAAYVAACRADEGDPQQLAEATALALAACGEAGAAIGRAAVQLHGGIGFTWEHDAHLFVRRLRGAQALFGGTTLQRERLWSATA